MNWKPDTTRRDTPTALARPSTTTQIHAGQQRREYAQQVPRPLTGTLGTMPPWGEVPSIANPNCGHPGQGWGS